MADILTGREKATVLFALPVQLPKVPVTVYTRVVVVDEITVAPVVVFRFVAGDHVKVVPGKEEEAVSVAVPDPQIKPWFTVTTGDGLTTMVKVFEYSAPVLSVTVY